MSTVVFVGPTLGAEQAHAELDATVCPPVCAGDVQRAVRNGATCIGIVDGFLDRTPAVRHKELLWALQRGLRVYGSASMGALRAAELWPYGMIGVGLIFERFRDGVLTADDEVVLVHGGAECGWRPASVPLVELRETLAAAVAAAVLPREAATYAVEAARTAFYPDRNYALVVDALRTHGLSAAAVSKFEAWLETGRVELKKQDALAMLRRMRDDRGSTEMPRFDFPHTVYFEREQSWVELSSADDEVERVLDELRLDPSTYLRVLSDARLRTLALAEASARGLQIDDILAATRERFLAAHRIQDRAAQETWMRDNGLTPSDFDQLLESEARMRLLLANLQERVEPRIADQLRAVGLYAKLRSRARRKRDMVALMPRTKPDTTQVLHWFFRARLYREPPSDLHEWATAAGWHDVDGMIAALEVEYLLSNPPDPAS